MTKKLRTALYGAAMTACLLAPAANASAQRVGMLTMVGPAESARVVHFDVMLPLRNMDKLETLLRDQQDPSSAQFHKWLTPAQFGAQFGPDKATIARVANYLQSHGFTVKAYTRSVRATGTADLVTRNFGAHLVTAKSDDGASHVVTGETMRMPAELASAGAQIFSFAPHAAHVLSHVVGGPLQVGKTRSASGDGLKQLHGYASNKSGSSDNRYSDTGPYWFDDLKQAYDYPSASDTIVVGGNTVPLNGKGATIAALMSSDILDSDIKALFDHENWSTITGNPDPTLAGRVYIDGGAPFNGSGASFEASLDTQEELTGAPGANVVLYDIPDLSDGNIAAGYIDVDELDNVDVVSSSFGECELFLFPKYNGGTDYRGILMAEHELYMQGNSEGISFLASSGDEAGKICTNPRFDVYIPGVSIPASDPNVTAVGGTNVVTTYVQGTLNSQYAGENAWADQWSAYGPSVKGRGWWGAGGGYSSLWPAPSYQSMVTTGSTMRALPDIGMQVGGCPSGARDYHPHANVCNGNNDPLDGAGNTQRSSVVVAVAVGQGGGFYALIGTSVSSPELAGVAAHIVERYGRMGNFNNYIYKLAAAQTATGRKYFHTNIPGYNGVVNTDLNSSYSLSVGVGTPVVTRFIGQPRAPRAGVPQTPSNP